VTQPDVKRHSLLYPEFFAGLDPVSYSLSPELFTRLWRQTAVDPRWLRVHVHKAAPSAVRTTWLYVTCGLSDPDLTSSTLLEKGLSGLGAEFTLETPNEAPWAMRRLQEIASLQLVIAAGRFGEHRLLDDEDLVPLHGPISSPSASALHWLLIAPARRPPYAFELASGMVRFRSLLGITPEEAMFAQQFGSDNLVVLLQRNGFFPLVDAERRSVVTNRPPKSPPTETSSRSPREP